MDIDEGPLGPPEEIPKPAQPAQPKVDSIEMIRRLQMELEECQAVWDRDSVALTVELE